MLKISPSEFRLTQTWFGGIQRSPSHSSFEELSAFFFAESGETQELRGGGPGTAAKSPWPWSKI